MNIEEYKDINLEELGEVLGKIYLEFAKGVEKAFKEKRCESKEDCKYYEKSKETLTKSN